MSETMQEKANRKIKRKINLKLNEHEQSEWMKTYLIRVEITSFCEEKK